MMKSKVSSISSQKHLENVTVEEIDLDYCIRNVSVQTGEEFSPHFLQNLTNRRKLQAGSESSQENRITSRRTVHIDPEIPTKIVENEKLVSGISQKDPGNGTELTHEIMKFLCSFGGKILTRPRDGKLRYVGGETRIMSIKKNLNYQELKKKTYDICNQPHIIKYQLPGEDLDELISVSSDEDFHHMIDEYQESEKSSQRLRLFLEYYNNGDTPFSSRASSFNLSDNNAFNYVVAVNGFPQPNLQKTCSDSTKILQLDPPSSILLDLTPQAIRTPHTTKTSCIKSSNILDNIAFETYQQPCEDHSILSLYDQTNVDFKKPIINEKKDNLNLGFDFDSEESQHTDTRQQSIATSISDTLSNQHNSSIETNPLLLTTSEEIDRIIHDLLIPNSNAFGPISIETSVGDMNLSQISDEKTSENECDAQSNSKDIEDDKKIKDGLISDTAMAEIQAGIHGLQSIKNGDLEEVCAVGCGTFGTVYHGKWRGTDVAIKRIKETCFSGKPTEEDRLTKEFWKEAEMLSQLHHPNVVALYGVVCDGPSGTLSTVTEYMANGSLRHVLSNKKRTLDERKKVVIAQDAAIGMEYLHSKNIVHFDLKCDNLLVNLGDPKRPVCKVADFGLSRTKRNSLVSGGARGTLPWIAPELLDGTSNRVSEKVDVFSFGIVLWEILTGEEPYADLHCGAIIGGIVTNSLRPTIPRHCDDRWKTLMEECWSNDPIDRPSFTQITNKLQAMSQSKQQKQPR